MADARYLKMNRLTDGRLSLSYLQDYPVNVVWGRPARKDMPYDTFLTTKQDILLSSIVTPFALPEPKDDVTMQVECDGLPILILKDLFEMTPQHFNLLGVHDLSAMEKFETKIRAIVAKTPRLVDHFVQGDFSVYHDWQPPRRKIFGLF